MTTNYWLFVIGGFIGYNVGFFWALYRCRTAWHKDDDE